MSRDDTPFVSIFIPCRTVDTMTLECIEHCKTLAYEKFEVILLPDEPAVADGVKVVPTGAVSPGKKRNMGATIASGEVFAYIDSDAYPKSDWLSNAVKYLFEYNAGAIGGPALTPAGDGCLAEAQDIILSSFLVGRGIRSRYRNSGIVETDDIPSVNFIAWKRVVEAVGGWDERFWPGEDTLICLRIKAAGHRQIFFPDVVVYHHRRRSWREYLRQVWNYGAHRGFFAKHFPETSRRAVYFVPPVMLLLALLLPLLSFGFSALIWLYAIGMASYLGLVLFVARRGSRKTFLLVFIGIPLTHLVYGLAFLFGLASRRLEH